MSGGVGAGREEVSNGGQSVSVTTAPRAADGSDPLPVEGTGGSRRVHVDVRPSGHLQVMRAVVLVARLDLDVWLLEPLAC